MMRKMLGFSKLKTLSLLMPMSLALSPAALADVANVTTPAPVIHLTDNLDEKDHLGWCLDTVGRGLSDKLHVHSCKPQGGDVQFRFDGEMIRSVPYDNLCAEMTALDPATNEFLLYVCENRPMQHFTYDAASSEIRPKGDGSLCLVAGDASRSAGPFMSRDLKLAPCADVDASLKQWTVVD